MLRHMKFPRRYSGLAVVMPASVLAWPRNDNCRKSVLSALHSLATILFAFQWLFGSTTPSTKFPWGVTFRHLSLSFYSLMARKHDFSAKSQWRLQGHDVTPWAGYLLCLWSLPTLFVPCARANASPGHATSPSNDGMSHAPCVLHIFRVSAFLCILPNIV